MISDSRLNKSTNKKDFDLNSKFHTKEMIIEIPKSILPKIKFPSSNELLVEEYISDLHNIPMPFVSFMNKRKGLQSLNPNSLNGQVDDNKNYNNTNTNTEIVKSN